MSEAVHQLQRRIETLQRTLRKIHTKHLNLKVTKDAVRSLVHDYFQEFRSTYISTGGLEADLAKVDSSMQDLLRCTQHRTLVSKYTRTLKEVSSVLHDLELKSVVPSTPMSITTDDIRHQKILETLAKIKPSAAASYEQALLDLRDSQRKSWRGTAVEFREALREALDTLAPDKDVEMQPGFKLEPNTTGPTMKQKAIFILRSRKASSKQVSAFTDAIEVVEGLVGKFVRSVYGCSSEATHTSVSKDEVLQIRDYVNLALVELLEIKRT